jgi:carboxyl-terminal processing protease
MRGILWPVALLPLLAAAAGPERVVEIADILGQRQLDPLPREQMLAVDAAHLQSLLRSRDPYARLLAPEEYAAFRSGDAAGVGIGMQLSGVEARWYLVPIPGGPAWDAGIQVRAELLSIEGRSVRGQSLDWVAGQLRGAAGSSVLLVLETGSSQLLARRVKRQPFVPPAVSYREEDGLAVLSIWDFRTRDTRRDLRGGLQRALESGRQPLIDLRWATGGDLYEALDCTGLFLPAGTTVAGIEYPDGQRRELSAPDGPRLLREPVLVLIGPGTASAAEAFALALQANAAGRLLGEPSYGKCLTQTLVPLSDGGAVRFSNGRLWGPAGTPCREQGLEPDLPVDGAESKSARALLEEAAGTLASKSAEPILTR